MPTPDLTTEQIAAVRATLKEAQDHARGRLEAVTRLLNDTEALCAHDWTEGGKVGPYDRRMCRLCGAQDFTA